LQCYSAKTRGIRNFTKLIEHLLANEPAASVNYLRELFFAESADFFQQSGFIYGGDLAYHDNAGF